MLNLIFQKKQFTHLEQKGYDTIYKGQTKEDAIWPAAK